MNLARDEVEPEEGEEEEARAGPSSLHYAASCGGSPRRHADLARGSCTAPSSPLGPQGGLDEIRDLDDNDNDGGSSVGGGSFVNLTRVWSSGVLELYCIVDMKVAPDPSSRESPPDPCLHFR